MPLLDHFHPPLSQRRHWESFHSAWATALADELNANLPEGYFAEEMITVGGPVGIDVATWDDVSSNSPTRETATMTKAAWTPPVPMQTIPATFPDAFSVAVFRSEGGLQLVAAIELVSPGNKDRISHRRAFAMKCASYLQRGIALAIVDIVTSRRANLHNEMIELLQQDGGRMANDPPLYATAYRPVCRNQSNEIDLWQWPLALDEDLPIVPLALSGVEAVPLDFEKTYQSVCDRRRID